MNTLKHIIFLSLFIIACKTPKTGLKNYETDTLKIVPMTAHSYMHITYLQTESFGKVGCNGLIFINNNEAVVFDTPADDTSSVELINYIENNLKCRIKAVVINHFHNDCLGGLKAFHKKNIPSYANNRTIELAKQTKVEVPQNGFDDKQELLIGNAKIINQYFGEAHTKDNIVSYIPSENALFGGCMVKEVGANFGFLGDANLEEWSKTVLKVKTNIPGLKYVVPGHGKFGGVELLDYTIEKFKNKGK
jgi:metallo-beta-lactamase class B